SHECRVERGSRGNHVGAVKMRQLNREQAYRAGCPVNQDTFAGLHLSAVEEALACGQSADRDGRRKFVSQGFRLERDALRLRQAELRRGAICKPVVQAVDFISDLETVGAFPE